MPPPEPPPAGVRGFREHDGFYFRIGLGFSYMADSIRSTGFDEATLSGAGIADVLAFGGTPLPGLVIGVAIEDEGAFTPALRVDGRNSAHGPNSLDLGSIGPFVDYYFDPSRGLHAQAFLGVSVLTADKDQNLPLGVGGSLGVGYEWWTGAQGSVGLLARLSYARLSYDPNGLDERHSVVAPALLVEFTYH